jgi:hypothetical protein
MIVPSFLINQAEIAKGVKKVEKQFKPDVVRIGHTIGEGWMGDPAIFFRVLLSDAAADKFAQAAISRRESARDLFDRIEQAMEAQVDPIGKWGLFPHFSYRSVSEQAHLKDKDWDDVVASK